MRFDGKAANADIKKLTETYQTILADTALELKHDLDAYRDDNGAKSVDSDVWASAVEIMINMLRAEGKLVELEKIMD